MRLRSAGSAQYRLPPDFRGTSRQPRLIQCFTRTASPHCGVPIHGPTPHQKPEHQSKRPPPSKLLLSTTTMHCFSSHSFGRMPVSEHAAAFVDNARKRAHTLYYPGYIDAPQAAALPDVRFRICSPVAQCHPPHPCWAACYSKSQAGPQSGGTAGHGPRVRGEGGCVCVVPLQRIHIANKWANLRC